MELYDFQAIAADQITDRTVAYFEEPIEITRGGETTRVPFVQFLSSITASGKTLILAEAVTLIAKQLPVHPAVLWLSKATVVVEQSFANLDAGGPYNELLQDSEVRFFADYDAAELSQIDRTFLFFATVGTFNRQDREKGLKVFRSSLDEADKAIWDELKRRVSPSGHRRPLLVVYDEAHNLSDQQTDLLLELDPDAFLLATATARLPARFNSEVVERLKSLGSRTDDDLTAHVSAKSVAESGLIKNEIELVGRQAPAETVIAEMIEALKATEAEGHSEGLEGTPKAVYVCKTNIVEGSDERDSARQPFAQRQAPPILIWRHLTEKLDIPPEEIAVYCNLSTNKDYPLPAEFTLFSKGDRDYERFAAGNYRHVIFNRTLQEGWDDPLVFFAYIDKSMGSRVETEQVVGRLLRQPGRHHYPSTRLNKAEIHVRVESAGVFESVVDAVQEKIRADNVPIQFSKTPPGRKAKTDYPPKGGYRVPMVAVVADEAESEIARHISRMTDYRKDDGTNTAGIGRRTRVQRFVGGDGDPHFVWEEIGESARVVARWLFGREVRRVHSLAMGMVMTGNGDGTPSKFDAMIGLGSNAAEHIADVARKVGHAYVDNVYLKLTRPNPYAVGTLTQAEDDVELFDNALHAGYSGLNTSLEMPFAHALDRTGLTWCRNPSQTGYRIPLVEPGKTKNFFPDFLVWHGENIYVIDTKGSHLHEDARRKLVSIRPTADGTTSVYVRFVSNGKVSEDGPTPDATGYTAWTFKPNGEPRFVHVETMDEAVDACLKPNL